MKNLPHKASNGPGRARVLIQLPRLLNYRVAEYAKIADVFDVGIAYSSERSSEGFGAKPTDFIDRASYFRLEDKSLGRNFTLQKGLISAIREFEPDILFIQSNVRYVSFWLALVYCWFRGIPVVGHGQGLYRFEEPGPIRRFIYAAHISLSTRYACYTELSRVSLGFRPINQRKLVVAANTLTNRAPVKWDTKTGAERGLLFLGRLRERNGLADLIAAIEDARSSTGEDIVLHLVGGGEKAAEIKSMLAERAWIRAHGPIYEDAKISEISRGCFAGVYPGDAGLSVVHYMSLSLPPIVHDNIRRHMGPEPSYVRTGENGFLFSYASPRRGMAAVISHLMSSSETLRRTQQEAFATYEELGKPGLGGALIAVFDGSLKQDRPLRRSRQDE